MRARLAEARARTQWLVEGVTEADMERVHDPLMSPLVWDLAHIAAFEELWICMRTGGMEPLDAELLHVYDAMETPRAVRGEVSKLNLPGARVYMSAVRSRALVRISFLVERVSE